MYKVSVLVKNLDSNSDELMFAKFRLKKIAEDDDDLFQKARNFLFPGKADKSDYIVAISIPKLSCYAYPERLLSPH